MSKHAGGFEIEVEQVDGFVFDVRFDKDHYEHLRLDEPEPLSRDSAPNAVRLLAAAIGNCLSASMVFCARRRGLVLDGVRAAVRVELVRNDARHLRVGRVGVTIDPGPITDTGIFQDCLSVFEDFCVVTQSVREGLQVDVEVAGATRDQGLTDRPRAERFAAAPGEG